MDTLCEIIPDPLEPGSLKFRFPKKLEIQSYFSGGGVELLAKFRDSRKTGPKSQDFERLLHPLAMDKDHTALPRTLTVGPDGRFLLSDSRGGRLQKRLGSVCFLPGI
jgi:hypothetical protein